MHPNSTHLQAIQECLSQLPNLSKNKLVLFGGSHGGFLVTHLAGQHPDMFAGVVCRNPATDLATMAQVSDIPDWIANETGDSYSPDTYTSSELEQLFKASPACHATKVKAPIYFMIGKEDLRVPPQQGIELYKKLRAMGRAKVKLNTYDDNHPLAKGPVHTDVMINTVIFYQQCLEKVH